MAKKMEYVTIRFPRVGVLADKSIPDEIDMPLENIEHAADGYVQDRDGRLFTGTGFNRVKPLPDSGGFGMSFSFSNQVRTGKANRGAVNAQAIADAASLATLNALKAAGWKPPTAE